MKIYIIEVELLTPTGKYLYTNISQEGYRTLQEAISFIKSRLDYQGSISDYRYYGEMHNYIIREITIAS